jgi:hypothetical protein
MHDTTPHAAVATASSLAWYLRHVHTAMPHAAGLPIHLEAAGHVFLGMRPHDLGW